MKRLNAHRPPPPPTRARTRTHTPRMAGTGKVSERRARVPGECCSANRYQGNGRASSSRSKRQGQSFFPRPADRTPAPASGLCQARRAGCRLSAPGRCSQLHPSSGKEPLPRQVQLGSLAAEVYTDPAGSGGEK